MVNPPVLYPVFSPPSPACLTTNDDTFRVEPRSTWRNAGDADEQNLLLFCRLPSTAFAGSSPPAHAADPVAGLPNARLAPRSGAAGGGAAPSAKDGGTS